MLRWANAGHLLPMVYDLDGRVEELADGGSTIIGAPDPAPRAECS